MTKDKDNNPYANLADRERHEWKQRKRNLWERIFQELEDCGEEELKEQKENEQ